MFANILGAAGIETARKVDYFLSFFSICYTFWFDRNSFKRIIIVMGVRFQVGGCCTQKIDAYPLPIRGGYFDIFFFSFFSHCVLLSAITYAPSPTPHPFITHHTHTTHTTPHPFITHQYTGTSQTVYPFISICLFRVYICRIWRIHILVGHDG